MAGNDIFDADAATVAEFVQGRTDVETFTLSSWRLLMVR
tara:strand:- start:394 stop:510 length:117 start_codon:yes stop_codon:yes gene_type:complete